MSVSVDTDAIDEVFAREGFDILHFHEPWVPVWSRQLVFRSRCANVATMHGRFMGTMTAKTITSVVTPYTKPMIKYFDAFTGVSNAAPEYFKGLSNRPVAIVPNGINIKKFTKAPKGIVRHSAKKTPSLTMGPLFSARRPAMARALALYCWKPWLPDVR